MKLCIPARTHFSSHKYKSQTSSLIATLVLLLHSPETTLTIQISHRQPSYRPGRATQQGTCQQGLQTNNAF